ncbi:parvulin-like peptidyl-prolyl isomerase [Frisingicoccus caecimuris]|uniref:Parvulin-like peptidyl-prolyl isomerase n=3 Tax=Frisingicoccus caecimuris TaxID=1796636 RepID=A0A4R2LES6_9FIRM|nr:parvulin-like peptidyl-prolyl isomerase [Frisingicoccus caecimuris]
MSDKEKKQNGQADGVNSQKPEKRMTKYDLKMQRRKEEELRQQRKARYSAIIGAVILLLIVGVLGWKFYDGYQDKHGTYVTVGDHDVQRSEYEYYYYSGINNLYAYYGNYLSYMGLDLSKPLDEQAYMENMTWKDYFDQQAVSQLKQVYALTDAAEAAGFEYDASADVDDFAESIETGAANANMSAADYLKSSYGTLATMDKVKAYVEKSSIATAYYNSIEDATEITDEEVSDYYDENKDNYDSVDYLACKIAADMPETETVAAEETTAPETETGETETLSEEEKAAQEAEKKAAEEAAMTAAKEKADEMLEQISDESSFENLYADYATDTAVELRKTNAKKSSISPTGVGQWLFDSARQAGDTTVIEDTTGNAYYVVYFIDRYLDHAKTVDVRHILIRSSAETTDEMTDEEKATAEENAKAEAKQKAEDIYAEWKNGDATEDSFAALAEANSEDTGSNTNGGLYEAVTKGQMAASFNDWIFDDARKPGDTEIVETEYGYHVMYFVGDNAEAWYVNIENTLRTNKMQEYITNLTADMEVIDERGNIDYLHVAETETESVTDTAAETETQEETESADK